MMSLQPSRRWPASETYCFGRCFEPIAEYRDEFLLNLRIVKQTQQDLLESLKLLCFFDRVFSRDPTVHYTTVGTIRQPTVKFLVFIFRRRGQGSFRPSLEGNVQERWKRHRFACLTINFDDMHSILD